MGVAQNRMDMCQLLTSIILHSLILIPSHSSLSLSHDTVNMATPSDVAAPSEWNPVLHASYAHSFLVLSSSDLLAQLAQLETALKDGDGVAMQIESTSTKIVAKQHQGRLILCTSSNDSDDEETVWSLLSDDNPLVAQKKAAAKAAAPSGGGKSSTAASSPSSASSTSSLPIADYAVELSLLLHASPCPAAIPASSPSSSAPSSTSSTSAPPVSVPRIQFERVSSSDSVRTFHLVLSVLHYADPSESVQAAVRSLHEALLRQLRRAIGMVKARWDQMNQTHPNATAFTIRSLHFQPPRLSRTVSTLYFHPQPRPDQVIIMTSGEMESSFPHVSTDELERAGEMHPALRCTPEEELLRSERKQLHEEFGLDSEQPYFRYSNAIAFPALNPDPSTSSSSSPLSAPPSAAPPPLAPPATAWIVQPRLLNAHESLPRGPTVGVSGGTQHLVRGDYAYYHYMQDKFNDNGWGCAYRTLQSICSWFILNGFVQARPVPSHRLIQTCLVRAGDKGPSFVGSKEWIGSTEVAIVLRELYGIETKTLFVSSGSEVESQASRVLRQHFDEQATPVMIGGGVLAYGLLGVDYNEQTGECRYLILDPHYTGADSISSIVKGGWVGWKRGDLFLQDHFYNFAMPQRPKGCI